MSFITWNKGGLWPRTYCRLGIGGLFGLGIISIEGLKCIYIWGNVDKFCSLFLYATNVINRKKLLQLGASKSTNGPGISGPLRGAALAPPIPF